MNILYRYLLSYIKSHDVNVSYSVQTKTDLSTIGFIHDYIMTNQTDRTSLALCSPPLSFAEGFQGDLSTLSVIMSKRSIISSVSSPSQLAKKPKNPKNPALEIAIEKWHATYGRSSSEVERERIKRVNITQEEPTLHYFDPNNGHVPFEDNRGNINGEAGEDVVRKSQLTEELTVLSTIHGRARRELRDISKHDLQTVMKYGTKTRGRIVNGEQRWMFELDNTVYITNYSCREEVTCFKKAISIDPANISDVMISNHEEAVRLLKDDPHICTTLNNNY